MPDYYTLLTTIGAARLANAQATQVPVNLTELAIGDGDAGAEYDPSESQVALKNEVWRGAINNLYVHAENANWLVVEAVVPEEDGGWYVREVGVFDSGGNLFAIGKYPVTYKPVLAAGSAKDVYIRMILEIGNTADVTLSIDPSIVLATRNYAQGLVDEHNAAADAHADATTGNKGFVELATIAETREGADATRAVTPAGVAAAIGDLRKTTLLERLLSAMADGSTGRALDAKPETYADTSGIDGASTGYTHDSAGAFIHNPGTEPPISNWDDAVASSGQIGNTNMQIGFVAPENTVLESVKVYVVSNPNPGWRSVKLHADNGGVPGDVISDSGWADYLLNTGTGPVTVPWVTPPNLVAGTTYWIVIGPYSSQPTESVLCQTVTGSADVLSLLAGAALNNDEDWQCEITFGASSATPDDATVISTALEAFAEPSAGYVLALVEPGDVVTYGTDYLIDLALDDGATWEAVTIAKIGTTEIDVAGTPTTVDVVYGDLAFATSGDQTIRSRQRSANAKYLKIHGLIIDAEV